MAVIFSFFQDIDNYNEKIGEAVGGVVGVILLVWLIVWLVKRSRSQS